MMVAEAVFSVVLVIFIVVRFGLLPAKKRFDERRKDKPPAE
jgi:hypothetical protein